MGCLLFIIGAALTWFIAPEAVDTRMIGPLILLLALGWPRTHEHGK